MKKTLSILLALTMLFALCVPSFAAKQQVNTIGQKNVIVKTRTDNGDGVSGSAENFVVSIPADVTIDWHDENEIDLSYDVEAHLARNRFIKVNVTAENDALVELGKHAMKAKDYNDLLPYTLEGTLDYTAPSPVVYGDSTTPAVKQNLTLKVAAEDWNKAIVDTYEDTLHFDISI